MRYNTIDIEKEGFVMSFWDDVGKGADEQWEFDYSMRRGSGGSGNTGRLDAFLKYAPIVLIGYAIFKFIFGR